MQTPRSTHKTYVPREENFMASHRSPAELFPNLFGTKPAALQTKLDMSPQDMRLLQYTMNKAGRRPSTGRHDQAPVRTYGKA
jgi:hypothetical protein